jgi:hypothetical protein
LAPLVPPGSMALSKVACPLGGPNSSPLVALGSRHACPLRQRPCALRHDVLLGVDPTQPRCCPEQGWFCLLSLFCCVHHDCLKGWFVCVGCVCQGLLVLLCFWIWACFPSLLLFPAGKVAGHHLALACSVGDLPSCPRGHFSDREPTTPTRRCRWWTSTSL